MLPAWRLALLLGTVVAAPSLVACDDDHDDDDDDDDDDDGEGEGEGDGAPASLTGLVDNVEVPPLQDAMFVERPPVTEGSQLHLTIALTTFTGLCPADGAYLAAVLPLTYNNELTLEEKVETKTTTANENFPADNWWLAIDLFADPGDEVRDYNLEAEGTLSLFRHTDGYQYSSMGEPDDKALEFFARAGMLTITGYEPGERLTLTGTGIELLDTINYYHVATIDIEADAAHCADAQTAINDNPPGGGF